MKRTILAYFSGLLSGILACGALRVFAPCGPTQENGEVSPTNSVVVETSVSETNRATSTQNVDWFKDSSNYIWDGWKIK